MRNPFVYGEEVSGENFCNRDTEIKELLRDIQNGQNVMIYSQRRFGKTSLIKEVLARAKRRSFVTVYVDLYPALSNADFVEIYARSISNAISGKIERVFKGVTEILKRLTPKISVDEGGKPQIEFEINRQVDITPYLEDVLKAVKRYSAKKKKQGVVVFDEFQQVGFFGDDKVEKQIRSEIQSHRNISYIFMGSKKHLIYDMFGNANRPLYKSTKHFPLDKIEEGELTKFIKAKFKNTSKSLPTELAKRIVGISERHPYYTQYLCHIFWELALDRKEITEQDIKESLELLLKRESAAYQNIWDMVTIKQKQVLLALARKVKGEKIFSSEFLAKNNLGSVSSVQRSLNSLIEKDLIDKEEEEYSFIDVFFKMWIREKYGYANSVTQNA
jgi:AAA+ ATPase superfamily predicted ATPase